VNIEAIRENPRRISSLPVSTISCRNPKEAWRISRNLLTFLGISDHAIQKSFSIIRRGGIRGAAVLSSVQGVRLDEQKNRGVRVSRLGITQPALRKLSSILSRAGINTITVREALILASKVASEGHIIAEFCISDNPEYTTGYIASKKTGYVRIQNIKQQADKRGGRVFFVEKGINIERMTEYLEKVPVVINRIAPCRGIISVHEILDSNHQ
jgi:6-carboxyhexanoate--CoA ligase